MTKEFKIGQRVHYIPFEGCDPGQCEKGIVKSISDENHVFVVYNCAGEWSRYQDYTAARTNIAQLKEGWPM